MTDRPLLNSDKDFMSVLASCNLCPRNCRVDRLSGGRGACGMDSQIVVARAALHFWEEPCISGTRGSGTVFFAGCGLRCCFCQNEPISRGHAGKAISAERLCQIFFELKEQGAHNINLVTPTHYIPQIAIALQMAKNKGLSLPVICNSSGYENVEALKIWDGLIDIYLPDLKFHSSKLSKCLCGAPDYFEKASLSLAEMYRQVGPPVFDNDGILQKGMIVRHLMLPGHLFDTKKILEYLTSTYENQIYISLMNQYTPPAKTAADPAGSMNSADSNISTDTKDIQNSNDQRDHANAPDHSLSQKHYEAMVEFLIQHNQVNAYTQESGTDSESFIPPFDLTGV